MNVIDRALSVISPKTAFKRAQYRSALYSMDTSFTGASRTKRSLRGWGVKSSGDPDDEILPELENLRIRTRDLYKNNTIGNGAIKTNVTNVIGPGLKLQSRIDYEFLGMTEEEADAWESKTERLFRLWAESTDADAGRRQSFYEIQQLAFLSTLQSGEVFALLPLIPRKNTISDLRVQLVEADRVCNPNYRGDTEEIAGGIETGKYGEPIAYHILTSAPGLLKLKREWKRVMAFGADSGRVNVIHLFKQERPGQRRGIPYLSPVIDTLKQLGRYTDAELTAAVVSSMFTVFITSDNQDGTILSDALPAQERNETEPQNYELAAGAMIGLAPGEKTEFANPTRPNAGFDGFVTSLLRQVGMALEIPYELLIRHFQASYSASRAALLEAWKFFRVKRAWVSERFCQPVYQEWLAEMILKGFIDAPGYFDSPAIARAYAAAEWVGPAPGQVDPVKETNAAELRVNLGISTLSAEAAEIKGVDWERTIRQRAKEEKMKRELGLTTSPTAPVIQEETNKDEGTDEEQNQN